LIFLRNIHLLLITRRLALQPNSSSDVPVRLRLLVRVPIDLLFGGLFAPVGAVRVVLVVVF
jgi:hypothetical protein